MPGLRQHKTIFQAGILDSWWRSEVPHNKDVFATLAHSWHSRRRLTLEVDGSWPSRLLRSLHQWPFPWVSSPGQGFQDKPKCSVWAWSCRSFSLVLFQEGLLVVPKYSLVIPIMSSALAQGVIYLRLWLIAHIPWFFNTYNKGEKSCPIQPSC